MSEQERYTAQEMRERSEIIGNCGVAAMLRQAADDAEEFERVRLEALDTLKNYAECVNELTQAHIERDSLKARLEEVAKKCANIKKNIAAVESKDKSFASIVLELQIDSVLRAARGEGGAE